MIRGLFAFLFGPILLIGSGVLLFWNEGRAVQTARSLAEGRGLVIEVPSTAIDPANDGKLIHVSGPVEAKAPVRDPQFAVSATGLRLVRHVEMYQWKEESGGKSSETGESHSYVRVWNNTRIDSSHFRRKEGHENPEMRFSRASFAATDAALGAFRPGERALTLLPADRRIEVTADTANGLRGKISGPVQEFDGRLYLGADPVQPRIGDLRISFAYTPNGPASFIGRQSGTDVTPYQTHAGDRLLMGTLGLVSADEMFLSAEHQNRVLTWVLRFAGAFLMFVGFAFLLSPLTSIASFIPLIGGLVAAAGALVAAMLTAVIAPAIIAIAWFWYRPLISAVVLLLGLAVAFGFKTLASRKAAQTLPADALVRPQTPS